MASFDGFEVDLAARRVRRSGRVEHLEPQAFDVLAYLVENRDRVVPKAELLDAVWGDQWVSEAALTTRIKEIRRATGDSGEAQSVIRTVRGRGYQLVAETNGPPPPAASDAAGTALDHLVGRGRDLQALLSRLRPGSVTTLVGPGGVGKTALARAVAGRSVSLLADDVITVDLGAVPDGAAVLPVVARAAGIRATDPAEVLRTLRGLHGLLLLDDADDLVAATGDLVAALTDSPCQLTVLVTCRERLGVPGEQLWPVLALSREDAADLLRARARDSAPLGSLADVDDATLESLASSVDCLALALEMLAAASAFLSVDELHRVIADQPALLTSPHRDARERHRSLDRLVTDSLARLTPPERQLLAVLSVFAGAFVLSDAGRVAEGGDVVVARSLAERSLLTAAPATTGGPRFQVLRTVSRATLGDTSAPEARRRHAEFVCAELEAADATLRSADERAGSDRFAELADEARAAHLWARSHDVPLALRITAALHLYAHTRMWAEPAQWATQIPGWRQHGAAVAAAASQASQEGRFDDAWELGRKAVEQDQPRVRAWGLEVLSDVDIYRDDLERAESWARDLVRLGQKVDDARMVALGATNTALSLTYADRTDEALALLDTSAGGTPVPRAPTDLAWLAFARGEALSVTGEEAAAAELDRAIALASAADSPFVRGVAWSTRAGLAVAAGETLRAIDLYVDMLETFRRHGNVTHLTVFLRNAVPLLSSLGEAEAAATVAGWVSRPHAWIGHGPDTRAMASTVDALYGTSGADAVAAWVELGARRTAPEIANTALTVFRRHHPSILSQSSAIPQARAGP